LEFEGQQLTPSELIEKVKDGHWKYLGPERLYQRLSVTHHCYGEVILLVIRCKLKNGKIVYDVLLCNCDFYTANRIDKCYLKRWNIEMQFKYYKQHLNLGKTPAQKIRSHSIFLVLCSYCRVIGSFVLSKMSSNHQLSECCETSYVIG
jgi:IS4 transposase